MILSALKCLYGLIFYVSPSSGFQPASPLKGEAMKRAKLMHLTASPLRGEAERSSDEGGIISFFLTIL